MTSPRDEQDSSGRKPGGAPDLGNWYALSAVGIEFIVAILGLGAVGWWLDGWLGSDPWLLVVGICVGFGVGLWMLLRASKRFFRD